MSNSTHTLIAEPKEILKKYFGYDEFRLNQEEVINHILEKRDSLVLMPTGGGKSICFQIPAMCLEGLTLVVSPLLALMKDQVDGLKANGIPAATINSMASEHEQRDILEEVYAKKIKLLYVSPEKLNTPDFLRILQQVKLSLVAIDESHCVSIWGNDFRSDYLHISKVRDAFSDVPFIALTATADTATQHDICRQLNLHDPKIFISSFERKNIEISSFQGLKRIERIESFIKKNKGSGIIYCLSRKGTEEVANKLSDKGHSARFYHAGMSADERKTVQNDFINDRINIICATIAFGMGIDKSNIRWVIHYNMPKNIEGFYQEIGRSGRDGLEAKSLLLYSYQDYQMLLDFVLRSEGNQDFKSVQEEKLNRMWEFATSSDCRTNMILNYFGEFRDEPCNHCDICNNPPSRINGTVLAQMALSAVYRCEEQLTIQLLIDVLRGSARSEIIEGGYDKIKTYGVGRDYSQFEWREYIVQLLNKGYLMLDYINGYKVKLTNLSREVLFNNKGVELIKPQFELSAKKKDTPQKFDLEPAKETLYDKLREWRSDKAKEESIPAYMIFTDATLKQLSESKIIFKSDLANVSGVGEKKLNDYGEELLEVIQDFVGETIKKSGKTYLETKKLLAQGRDVNEIAQIKGVHLNTIFSHIAYLYEKDELHSLEPYLTHAEYKEIINAAIKINEFQTLKPIYEWLEERIEYSKIRLALSMHKKLSSAK